MAVTLGAMALAVAVSVCISGSLKLLGSSCPSCKVPVWRRQIVQNRMIASIVEAYTLLSQAVSKPCSPTDKSPGDDIKIGDGSAAAASTGIREGREPLVLVTYKRRKWKRGTREATSEQSRRGIGMSADVSTPAKRPRGEVSMPSSAKGSPHLIPEYQLFRQLSDDELAMFQTADEASDKVEDSNSKQCLVSEMTAEGCRPGDDVKSSGAVCANQNQRRKRYLAVKVVSAEHIQEDRHEVSGPQTSPRKRVRRRSSDPPDKQAHPSTAVEAGKGDSKELGITEIGQGDAVDSGEGDSKGLSGTEFDEHDAVEAVEAGEGDSKGLRSIEFDEHDAVEAVEAGKGDSKGLGDSETDDGDMHLMGKKPAMAVPLADGGQEEISLQGLDRKKEDGWCNVAEEQGLSSSGTQGACHAVALSKHAHRSQGQLWMAPDNADRRASGTDAKRTGGDIIGPLQPDRESGHRSCEEAQRVGESGDSELGRMSNEKERMGKLTENVGQLSSLKTWKISKLTTADSLGDRCRDNNESTGKSDEKTPTTNTAAKQQDLSCGQKEENSAFHYSHQMMDGGDDGANLDAHTCTKDEQFDEEPAVKDKPISAEEELSLGGAGDSHLHMIPDSKDIISVPMMPPSMTCISASSPERRMGKDSVAVHVGDRFYTSTERCTRIVGTLGIGTLNKDIVVNRPTAVTDARGERKGRQPMKWTGVTTRSMENIEGGWSQEGYGITSGAERETIGSYAKNIKGSLRDGESAGPGQQHLRNGAIAHRDDNDNGLLDDINQSMEGDVPADCHLPKGNKMAVLTSATPIKAEIVAAEERPAIGNDVNAYTLKDAKMLEKEIVKRERLVEELDAELVRLGINPKLADQYLPCRRPAASLMELMAGLKQLLGPDICSQDQRQICGKVGRDGGNGALVRLVAEVEEMSEGDAVKDSAKDTQLVARHYAFSTQLVARHYAFSNCPTESVNLAAMSSTYSCQAEGGGPLMLKAGHGIAFVDKTLRLKDGEASADDATATLCADTEWDNGIALQIEMKPVRAEGCLDEGEFGEVVENSTQEEGTTSARGIKSLTSGDRDTIGGSEEDLPLPAVPTREQRSEGKKLKGKGKRVTFSDVVEYIGATETLEHYWNDGRSQEEGKVRARGRKRKSASHVQRRCVTPKSKSSRQKTSSPPKLFSPMRGRKGSLMLGLNNNNDNKNRNKIVTSPIKFPQQEAANVGVGSSYAEVLMTNTNHVGVCFKSGESKQPIHQTVEGGETNQHICEERNAEDEEEEEDCGVSDVPGAGGGVRVLCHTGGSGTEEASENPSGSDEVSSASEDLVGGLDVGGAAALPPICALNVAQMPEGNSSRKPALLPSPVQYRSHWNATSMPTAADAVRHGHGNRAKVEDEDELQWEWEEDIDEATDNEESADDDDDDDFYIRTRDGQRYGEQKDVLKGKRVAEGQHDSHGPVTRLKKGLSVHPGQNVQSQGDYAQGKLFSPSPVEDRVMKIHPGPNVPLQGNCLQDRLSCPSPGEDRVIDDGASGIGEHRCPLLANTRDSPKDEKHVGGDSGSVSGTQLQGNGGTPSIWQASSLASGASHALGRPQLSGVERSLCAGDSGRGLATLDSNGNEGSAVPSPRMLRDVQLGGSERSCKLTGVPARPDGTCTDEATADQTEPCRPVVDDKDQVSAVRTREAEQVPATQSDSEEGILVPETQDCMHEWRLPERYSEPTRSFGRKVAESRRSRNLFQAMTWGARAKRSLQRPVNTQSMTLESGDPEKSDGKLMALPAPANPPLPAPASSALPAPASLSLPSSSNAGHNHESSPKQMPSLGSNLAEKRLQEISPLLPSLLPPSPLPQSTMQKAPKQMCQSTVQKTPKRMCLLGSNLGEEGLQELEIFCSRVGASMQKKFSKSVTHVVTTATCTPQGICATRTGKETNPHTLEQQAKMAAIVKENKERKEREKQAKLKAIADERAAKMKEVEEEMKKKEKAVEEEAAAEEEKERMRIESREGSSGTKKDTDAEIEKKISKWVANLSLGEDEEVESYVTEDEKAALAAELATMTDPMERREREDEQKLQWKLRMKREKRRRREEVNKMTAAVAKVQECRPEVLAQPNDKAKWDKVLGYVEVLSQAWMEERQASWSQDVALSAMRSGFREFAREIVTHIGGEVKQLRDNVGKYCEGAIEGAKAIAAAEGEGRPRKELVKLKFPDAYGGKEENFDNWEALWRSAKALKSTMEDLVAVPDRGVTEPQLVQLFYRAIPEALRGHFFDKSQQTGITYDALSREVVLYESKSMPVTTFWHKDLEKGKKWKDRTISGQVKAKDHLILTLEEGGAEEVPYDQIEWGLGEEYSSVGQGRSYAAVAAGGRPQVVYLDDILVFSKTLQEHQGHLRQVLEKLREANFKINAKKCEWAKTQVLYLGHVLDGDGIKPEDRKIAVIRDWPTPPTLTELRSFLGLANYYRKFVRNFSTVAAPLRKLLKKEAIWQWDKDCTSTLKKLKRALIEYPVLKVADPSLPFVVTTDASQYGIGAVLQQDDDNGYRPVEFMSARMPCEKRRTFKIMAGMLTGCWILSLDWIQKSLLDEAHPMEDFEVASLKSPEGPLTAGGPRHGRIVRSQSRGRRLLEGISIYFSGEFNNPTREDLCRLVRLGGGRILPCPPCMPTSSSPAHLPGKMKHNTAGCLQERQSNLSDVLVPVNVENKSEIGGAVGLAGNALDARRGGGRSMSEHGERLIMPLSPDVIKSAMGMDQKENCDVKLLGAADQLTENTLPLARARNVQRGVVRRRLSDDPPDSNLWVVCQPPISEKVRASI
ncbi:hypothetical protein CBR_g54344 [Chara braunii]|uniref:BRCT domain-containing protein n=1 Tax=Chara braunii TaxID=69332 RepID=A0A388MCA1_CHABU|nr:hypothetical protein CBR_g54344 [Chara braunii]|eukprot:GBG92089.1 hypothetical protein CBR_g54344 [Chara braunii]